MIVVSRYSISSSCIWEKGKTREEAISGLGRPPDINPGSPRGSCSEGSTQVISLVLNDLTKRSTREPFQCPLTATVSQMSSASLNGLSSPPCISLPAVHCSISSTEEDRPLQARQPRTHQGSQTRHPPLGTLLPWPTIPEVHRSAGKRMCSK